MANPVRITRGLDIPIEGKASSRIVPDSSTTIYAVAPSDYTGVKWKTAVSIGDHVDIGSALLFDKETSRIKLTAPVAGEVVEINRGARRRIEYIAISRIGLQNNVEFACDGSPASIRKALQDSGLWAMIRQRPYDIVPDADAEPRDIFVTSFDSSPLAPDLFDNSDLPMLEAGLKALKTLTSGKVWLAVKDGTSINSDIAEIVEFSGPHPAGNPGTQIAAIAPVNKGETVFTLSADTAVRIGKLVTSSILNTSVKVAVTGPKAINPHIISTHIGAKLSTLLSGCLPSSTAHLRVVSGNVLTGIAVDPATDFIHYPYRQITILKEGDDADEFMGWASLKPDKYSVKRTFPSFLTRRRTGLDFDSRLRGGRRAMILSGEYDKVFPFDIYPEYLIKSFISKDIERMEKLGAYEVAPEDFALAEFVDTSKLPLQSIVRDSLDYMLSELS